MSNVEKEVIMKAARDSVPREIVNKLRKAAHECKQEVLIELSQHAEIFLSNVLWGQSSLMLDAILVETFGESAKRFRVTQRMPPYRMVLYSNEPSKNREVIEVKKFKEMYDIVKNYSPI